MTALSQPQVATIQIDAPGIWGQAQGILEIELSSFKIASPGAHNGSVVVGAGQRDLLLL